MVGPEDAGACPGRNPKLLPAPAPEPVGQDGKMIRASSGCGGGVGAVEPPEEEEGEEEEAAAEEEEEEGEEETPPQRLFRRYLQAAGAPLEPGLCHCPPPAAPRSAGRLPRRRGMTNGDSGFLPGRGRRDLDEARGLAGAGGREPGPRHLRLEPPGDEGAGSGSDWAAPLEDPLRSCCLAATGAESSSEDDSAASGEDLPPRAGPRGPGEGASPTAPAERTSGGADPGPDAPRHSRGSAAEGSSPPSSRDRLPRAAPPGTSPAAEQGPSGGPGRAGRSGGLADFLARNLFPKRTKELKSLAYSAPGWKLFGKVPPRENLQKTSKIIQQEYEARTGRTCKPPPQSLRRKNFEFEPLSTTALILEDRPSNLPAKSVEEALRHRQEYDEMVVEAKKRELYEIFLSRAKERWKSFSEASSENDSEGVSLADREGSLELIKLDISRTFPSLYIFQKGGPYHDVLHSILGAYTCYRPDVGYVQGMSFIAAVLILNLEEADAFIAFANLLNKPCQLAFFRVDHSMMLKYFATFEVFFEENLSKLFLHFKSYSLTPDIYLIDWIFTLYSKSLPLDLACRVWDVFCRDGEEFLFRTGLGILRLYEDILLQMDFIHIAQFLTKLPEDITSEKLFSCIAAIQMQNSTKKWAQAFASVMKDIKEGDKNNSPALKS
ncbi:TBC1 domain family member 12 isoform X3 [Erinaceus europaeus]|uniref:TBC1 domain family member 12 isoform X3 n=1 Tax=Erinaceus europaeus TaxID=9365 RepID=A0ABM3XHE4_ERIEU|nr:TBC1 domain family member 12 isoform X3 [Erinaceus europaeus]